MALPKTKSQRKVTINLPTELLEQALSSTNSNITDTIRQGLELISAQWAYKGIRNMRGKVKFKLNLAKIRNDRV